MGKTKHGIICFETEWLHNNEDNRFNLQTSALLNFLKDFYGCDVIHKSILTKADLQYYIDYFSKGKYLDNDIIYFATHGCPGHICLEGEKKSSQLLSLKHLAEMANGSFGNAIIHFSSCETFKDHKEILEFKKITKAAVVSGYTKKVDAVKSAISDLALLNYYMNIEKKVGIVKNRDKSSFWQTYKNLLDELGFETA